MSLVFTLRSSYYTTPYHNLKKKKLKFRKEHNSNFLYVLPKSVTVSVLNFSLRTTLQNEDKKGK